jgi:hypothetical protein
MINRAAGKFQRSSSCETEAARTCRVQGRSDTHSCMMYSKKRYTFSAADRYAGSFSGQNWFESG